MKSVEAKVTLTGDKQKDEKALLRAEHSIHMEAAQRNAKPINRSLTRDGNVVRLRYFLREKGGR